jgi:hypothetical protein
MNTDKDKHAGRSGDRLGTIDPFSCQTGQINTRSKRQELDKKDGTTSESQLTNKKVASKTWRKIAMGGASQFRHFTLPQNQGNRPGAQQIFPLLPVHKHLGFPSGYHSGLVSCNSNMQISRRPESDGPIPKE